MIANAGFTKAISELTVAADASDGKYSLKRIDEGRA